MQFITIRTFAAAAITAIAAGGGVQAQDYPSRPIRIVTMEAGGGNDAVARLIAAGIGPGLGQSIVVENRGGAGGLIAIDQVVKAAPDGYTLLSMSGAVWILPLMQSVPYDPLRDLAPISLTAGSPAILVIHPSVPANNVRELIALAKAKPGQLNYAIAGAASAGNFAVELFKSAAGVDLTRISYKGGGQVMTDLVAGRVQISFNSIASSMTQVKAGKLRALAVTSAQPSALAPGVPTIASEALPGYEQTAGFGFFAPGKTPAAVVNRISQETMKSLRTPDMQDRFLKAGADVIANTPQQFTAFIKADQAKLGKIIKEAGITAE